MTNKNDKPKSIEAVDVKDTGKRVDIKTLKNHTVLRKKTSAPIPQKEIKIEEPHRNGFAHPKVQMAPPAIKTTLIEEDGLDFASMMEEVTIKTQVRFQVGQKVQAQLIHLTKDFAFFALNNKEEGSLALSELKPEQRPTKDQVGQWMELFITSLSGGITLSQKLQSSQMDKHLLEDAKNQGLPVEGKIISVNTGGYEVSLGQARGFCPLGQMDVQYIDNPKEWIGRTEIFLITQITENGRNIVLSRRKKIEQERSQKAKDLLSHLAEGDVLKGNVTRLLDFGAFVDIGGLEGLIPLSELGYGMRNAVSDYLHLHEEVTVQVKRIEEDPKKPNQKRILLSMKALQPDPYTLHESQIKEGETLEGKVVRLEDFGAFVELFPGILGLIHISELSEQRVKHPKEVLTLGDAVTVRVLQYDPETHKVKLSLRENIDKKTSKEPQVSYTRGQKIEGTVERTERYGVFLRLPGGPVGLLPASETGLPPHADMSKAYSIGQLVSAMVIDVDERGRIRLSVIALAQAQERMMLENYQQTHMTSKGMGTLGDLLSKQLKKG